VQEAGLHPVITAYETVRCIFRLPGPPDISNRDFLDFADLDFMHMPHIALKAGATYPRCGMRWALRCRLASL
jgi:hypothetical protein